MRTRHLSLVTQTHSVTTISKSTVLSPFGPANQDWIILRKIQDQLLEELLSSSEKKISDLNIKSCTVLDIFLNDTKTHLVTPTGSICATTGTK